MSRQGRLLYSLQGDHFLQSSSIVAVLVASFELREAVAPTWMGAEPPLCVCGFLARAASIEQATHWSIDAKKHIPEPAAVQIRSVMRYCFPRLRSLITLSVRNAPLHPADIPLLQHCTVLQSLTGYGVFDRGLQQGAFVNITMPGSSAEPRPLINVVWPGWTAFPDFTSPSARSWWASELQRYLSAVDVDGLWLDMNELGTFCAGYCPNVMGTSFSVDWATLDWSKFQSRVCDGNCTVALQSPLNGETALLNNSYQLYNKTLDMTGDLYLGKYYDTKTFYAMMEAKATFEALRGFRPNVRPFILTRASFAGTGRFAAHWTGDNDATFAPEAGGLVDSIQAVLAAGLWGIPMIGADIGGFGGQASNQLFSRWSQLGMWYSFSRFHHDNRGPHGQEPYRFGAETVNSVRTAALLRYKLLPFLFSLLVKASRTGVPAVVHPSFVFPSMMSAFAADDPLTGRPRSTQCGATPS